jgi:hypothetical protein
MRGLWLAILAVVATGAIAQAAEVTAPRPAPSASDPRAGMRIQLDDQGRPMATPEGSSSPAAPQAGQAARTRSQPTVEQDAPGGGRMIVNDRLRTMTVGRVGADGHVTVECVHGRPEDGGTGRGTQGKP